MKLLRFLAIEDVGLIVREARTSAELTQTGLAERLDVSRRTIARLEAGDEGVSIETVIGALRACGVVLAAVPRGATVEVRP